MTGTKVEGKVKEEIICWDLISKEALEMSVSMYQSKFPTSLIFGGMGYSLTSTRTPVGKLQPGPHEVRSNYSPSRWAGGHGERGKTLVFQTRTEIVWANSVKALEICQKRFSYGHDQEDLLDTSSITLTSSNLKLNYIELKPFDIYWC